MNNLHAIIQQIHHSPTQLVLATTGGGSLAAGELLVVPGASQTVLEAVVPYSEAALVEWLQHRPEQFCSALTARRMAMASYQTARSFAEPGVPLLGIGCTCSLASDRPKRGDHRAFLALQTREETSVRAVTLVKQARSRREEEELISRWMVTEIASACGISTDAIQLPWRAEETIGTERVEAPPRWQALLHGETQAVFHQVRGGEFAITETSPSEGLLIFPGAFNPPHEGHRQMVEFAESRCGQPVALEIAIQNVDKPPLDYLDFQARLQQFQESSLWLTRASRFTEKARLFPGATFLVGADTIRRIGDPKYYHDCPQQRDEALASLSRQGCRFLVFGRLETTEFRTLADLDLPPALAALCEAIPESEFRVDISSTELRRRASGE